MRFVAGRGAVATEMLAGAPWWKAIENQLLAEAPWWLSCCWLEDATEQDATEQDAAEQDAVGRGALEETLAGCIVVDLLARAPRRCCWPRVPWRRGWRHRGRSGSIGKKLRGMEQCTKKPAGVSGCETLAGVR